MIPFASDAVNYDIISSFSSDYLDLNFLDPAQGNEVYDGKESHFTSVNGEVSDFIKDDVFSTDDGSFDLASQPELIDAFFGLVLPDIDNDLFDVSPAKAFGLSDAQETQTAFDSSNISSSSASASPSYIADHDHCYSIVTKSSDIDKSQSPGSSLSPSESPSEASSSEEEVDIITVPNEPREQLLLAVPTQEAPSRKSRGKKSRVRARRVPQITIPKPSKVPVQRIKVRGSRSSRHKMIAGSSPSCSDDDSAKRKEHNYSERQRRRDQQNLLQNLRRSIPELETVMKAPKVRILDTARRFINVLTRTEKTLCDTKADLAKKNEKLLQKYRTLMGDRHLSKTDYRNLKNMKKFLRNKL